MDYQQVIFHYNALLDLPHTHAVYSYSLSFSLSLMIFIHSTMCIYHYLDPPTDTSGKCNILPPSHSLSNYTSTLSLSLYT